MKPLSKEPTAQLLVFLALMIQKVKEGLVINSRITFILDALLFSSGL